LDLLIKYEKWEDYWLENNENWAMEVQVMPFWTNMYLSRPYTLINQFKACQICFQANPMYSMLSWTKLHLNGLNIAFLTHLKKDQSPIFHMWPSRPFIFNLNYVIMVYFTFDFRYNTFVSFRWCSLEVILNYSSYVQWLIT